MSEPQIPPTENPAADQLADILEDYCRQLDQGLDLSPEACLQAHPELAEELANCLEGLDAIKELREALEQSAAELPPRPHTLGDFELLREIGRGGMGVVYEARQRSLDRRVALKMIRAGDLASPEEWERFLAEAQVVARLQHPHIVQIYEVGELEGRPYLVLELVEGTSLDAVLAPAPLPPRQAAELAEKLARAIHHAHQRGVIHRDLKPANILLTRDGVPKITDFGLAKRLDAQTEQTRSGAILGTASYMAPEQAAGHNREVSAASDIYALGAILYECLTGRAPFKAATVLETLAEVVAEEPLPPRRLQQSVPRDLETICLKCLHKDPRSRYASALALAEDLRCFLAGEPIRARPPGRIERLGRWCWRHPAFSLGALATVLLFLSLTVTAISVARTRAALLQQEVLQSNLYAAQGVASTVLWHLEQLSGPVVQTAEDPEFRSLMEKKDRAELRRFVDKVHRTYAAVTRGFVQPDGEPAFQSWHVLGLDGTLLADSGKNQAVVGENFSGRDYFQGALRHRGQRGRAAIHVSRVYRSRNDNLSKFAITAPVYASQNPTAPIRGVIAATFTTTSTLGSLHLNDSRRTAVLVGRRDTNRHDAPAATEAPAEYLILLHPLYKRGDQAIAVPADRFRAIHQPRPGDVFRLPEPGPEDTATQAVDAEYTDPVAARNAPAANRWLLGFAPVGNTEFVVLVQQRHDEVMKPDQSLVLDLVLWGGVAPVGVLIMGVLGWYGMVRIRFGHTSQKCAGH